MNRTLLAAVSICGLSLLLCCGGGNDKPASDGQATDAGAIESGTPQPGVDSQTPSDSGTPPSDSATPPPPPSDSATPPPPSDSATPPPPSDSATPPPPSDSGTPPVPSDPTICKDCSANGNDDCPDNGANTYMCVSAWYQPPTGAKIEESYCARRCETIPCPDNFSCETMSSPPAKVCIPQPHSVCALLGQ